MAQKSEATWLQVSPNPAMQLQWPASTLPEHSEMIHGSKGFSLILE